MLGFVSAVENGLDAIELDVSQISGLLINHIGLAN